MDSHEAAAAPGEPARCPMHTPEFAADPQRIYDRLRAQGPAAPVELSPGVDATLVVEHETALAVLRDTELFSRDSSAHWAALLQGRVPMDSPVLPMMAARPGNCMFSDGAAHLRLRKAVSDSLDRLNMNRLRRDAEVIADYLIDQFSPRGTADLLNEYARLLALLLFNKLYGCPAEIGDRLASAMADIFDGKDALRADKELTACLLELIALKRRQPGEDMASWLIQHESGLTDAEVTDSLVLLMGAGVEPVRNLIGSALLLLLSDDVSGGGSGMLIEEALDQVLWRNPPVANYGTHYPLEDIELGGLVVSARTPVLISFAAANSDPAFARVAEAQGSGAHLAWGAGPHTCPAKDPARVIAVTAIEKILKELPDISLAVPKRSLQWRPGPFHRALAQLPVRFTRTPATRVAAALTTTAPRTAPAAAAAVPAAPVPPAPAARPAAKKGFWSTIADLFRV